jgi:hypothetical protein
VAEQLPLIGHPADVDPPAAQIQTSVQQQSSPQRRGSIARPLPSRTVSDGRRLLSERPAREAATARA